eukprot:TRINITY_DN301_c0_g1_i1.p1 TRINITY_DN301_c0_g1~~TRINITY_DN301_c0_g1_i1.p1  ORF type:complete len:127 (-),score=20.59 TRINITY_DN301_c0_g1_i1:88-468(-)
MSKVFEDLDLTENCINDIFVDGKEIHDPVVQVLEIIILNKKKKKINTCKLSISDGTHYYVAFLTSINYNLIENYSICKGSIIKLTDYIINVLNGRRLLIILSCKVLRTDDEILTIGDPIQLENNNN